MGEIIQPIPSGSTAATAANQDLQIKQLQENSGELSVLKDVSDQSVFSDANNASVFKNGASNSLFYEANVISTRTNIFTCSGSDIASIASQLSSFFSNNQGITIISINYTDGGGTGGVSHGAMVIYNTL